MAELTEEQKAAKAEKLKKQKAETAKKELGIMKSQKVDVLYKNHKGEYFTDENRAALSITAEEKKKGKKVTKLERQVLEGKTSE